jgi:hypothetical protein
LADCQVLPIDARLSELFEKEKEFSVFLRPDNHIAFISAEISPLNVAEYLRATFRATVVSRKGAKGAKAQEGALHPFAPWCEISCARMRAR